MKKSDKRKNQMNRGKGNHLAMLLAIALLIFGGYHCYDKLIKDTEPPVLSCSNGLLLEVSVEASEKELLKGVVAEDNRSGDVTESVVIEDISKLVDGERVITYAAIDKRGNVGRIKRTLKYTDYEEPEFTLNGALRFPYSRSVSLLKKVGAESTLDGDLSANVKYSTKETIIADESGTYEVEFRVTDSAGTMIYLPAEVEIYNPLEETITVELSEYLVYIEKGKTFSPEKYYESSSKSGELSIKSNVNTSEEGVYTVDYTVNSGSSKGKSRLIVVVKDK